MADKHGADIPFDPDRNLALARPRHRGRGHRLGPLRGTGDKHEVDQAAVDAMRPVLGSVGMRG